MDLGADAVQMGTRFIGTYECDASPVLKQVLLDSKEEDIVIVSSPVGYPGRAVKTNLIKTLEPDTKKIKCVINCIFP